MRSTKSLVHWAAAAIVMIAAYVLSPGAAFAHAGHAHVAAVSISVPETSQVAGQGRIEASSPESAQESLHAPQSAGHAIPDSDPQAPCTETCCVLAGASCCGAAVACGPPGSAAGLGAGQRFAPSHDSVPPGLSAQALQESPRVQL
jgi:hypothetical protein